MKMCLGLIVLLAILTTDLQNSSPAGSEGDSNKSLSLADVQELVELADSLRKKQELNSALLVAETALEMMEEEDDGFDSLRAYTLMRLGEYYAHSGIPAKASQYFARCASLEERECWLGRDGVAMVIRRLGHQYRVLGYYSAAESTLNEGIRFIQSAPGGNQHELVRCLVGLGTVYRCQLRYAEAEQILDSALALRNDWQLEYKQRIGLEATILGQLGNLYFDQGRLSKAESLYSRAYDLAIERWGSNHQNPSEHLNNLGRVCMKQGLYAQAESLCSEALQKRAGDIGLDHPWTVYQLLNLADLHALQGNQALAEFYSRLCLRTIEEAGYGEHHPQIARATRTLADCNRLWGRYLDAEGLYHRALDTFKGVFGKYHPEVARSFESLGLLYAFRGENKRSLSAYDSMLASKQFFINRVFYHASERQKMRYISTYPLIDYPLLSLALADSTGGFQNLGLEMMLRGKAVVIDALSRERENVELAEDSNLVRTWESWKKVIDEISALSLSDDYHLEASKELVDGLWATKDFLEAELSKYPEFKEALAKTDFVLADIADIIPESGVLWEFVRYTPFDLKKLRDDPEAMGDPRYLAFTLDGAGKVTMTDLGDAQWIDSLIAFVRDHMSQEGYAARFDTEGRLERQLKQTTRTLYEIIFAPLQSQTADKTDILISPDGQLNLLPFEILPCADGRYVIEKFGISYISTGRDLLKFREKALPIQQAVIIADPDFDIGVRSTVEHRKQPSGNYPVWPSVPPPPRAAGECLEIPFDRIPNTEEEAQSIANLLRRKAGLNVTVYLNAEAREEVLKKMSSPPQILHLATHGFFCEKTDRNPLVDHPLLRSGLLFASANCSILGREGDSLYKEDGILTALEASGLDLIGTELVVVSACKTGVGEVKTGEGVYGLRRALQHAGARAIIMSLWAVPDEETRELMVSFYENWISRGQSKKDALRHAALKVLNDRRARNESTHPALWGGFVLLGDPK
jgi:CHAT domain-containing protein